MMSLVATPIVAARVAAPKKVRTQTVAKASSADQAKSSAVAGALALTMLAQPALAMNELGQIADKQADAKALAAAQFAELQVKKKAPTAAPKTKNLAAGLPSFSLPSISAPSVGGGSKSAPAVKAAKAAPAEKIEGQGKLGFAMAILFSPLIAVAGLSLQTLLRVVPQAAEGKDFFPKDTMPF